MSAQYGSSEYRCRRIRLVLAGMYIWNMTAEDDTVFMAAVVFNLHRRAVIISNAHNVHRPDTALST